MVRRLFLALLLASSLAAPAFAQAGREAALRVTVADQTGAIIVNARVTVLPTEPAGPRIEVLRDEHGDASLSALPPGRSSVRAEFPGFEPRQLDDLRLRGGSN